MGYVQLSFSELDVERAAYRRSHPESATPTPTPNSLQARVETDASVSVIPNTYLTNATGPAMGVSWMEITNLKSVDAKECSPPPIVASVPMDEEEDTTMTDSITTATQTAGRRMREAEQLVAELPNQLQQIQSDRATLNERCRAELLTCTNREQEQCLLRSTQTIHDHLRALERHLHSRVDESILKERMRQMFAFFARIPATEKSERSLLESWNAMFDVNAIVPRVLAKDYCPRCMRPLLSNRKQAQLVCVSCARSTEQLQTISQGGGAGWLKSAQAAQPENKRIKSVIARLNQFRVGTPPIPPEVVLAVRQWLKARNHFGPDTLALPTPVAAALHARGYERYVPFASKIANLVNGQDVVSLDDAQLNEIVSRLRSIQFVITLLQGRVANVSSFNTNFLVANICRLRGWHSLAAAFPPQRTKRILRDQVHLWRVLLSYLRAVDSQHAW